MSLLKVILLEHTPNPEMVIASAAKLCYSAVGIEEVSEKLTEESANKFIAMLASIGHGSPFEHASFTFAIEGVSRTLTHQLVRHRLASYSQQSQRYVKLAQFEYIIPPTIEKSPEAKKIFIETMERDQESYDALIGLLQEQAYSESVSAYLSDTKFEDKLTVNDIPAAVLGVFWKDAGKKVIEDARYVFPNACETKIIVTMNARELMHFFGERICNRAQWEIREMAYQMLILAKGVAPSIFSTSGPGCVYGNCPEGKMSCGKAKEVREKFKFI